MGGGFRNPETTMSAASTWPDTVAKAAPATPSCRCRAKAEDQNRVQHDIGRGAGDLGQHGQAHVAAGLVDLAPGTLQKHTRTAHADDGTVCHGKVRHGGGLRGDRGKGAHQQAAQYGEDQPTDQRQDRPCSGGPVG